MANHSQQNNFPPVHTFFPGNNNNNNNNNNTTTNSNNNSNSHFVPLNDSTASSSNKSASASSSRNSSPALSASALPSNVAPLAIPNIQHSQLNDIKSPYSASFGSSYPNLPNAPPNSLASTIGYSQPPTPVSATFYNGSQNPHSDQVAGSYSSSYSQPGHNHSMSDHHSFYHPSSSHPIPITQRSIGFAPVPPVPPATPSSFNDPTYLAHLNGQTQQSTSLSTNTSSYATRGPRVRSKSSSGALNLSIPASSSQNSNSPTSLSPPSSATLPSSSKPVRSRRLSSKSAERYTPFGTSPREYSKDVTDKLHRDKDGNGKDKTYICEECGKVYKHPNCLNKHRWEHSEYWKETSKLSLSKHQQVQLLEAAQILISMDHPTNSAQSSLNSSPNLLSVPSGKRERKRSVFSTSPTVAHFSKMSMQDSHSRSPPVYENGLAGMAEIVSNLDVVSSSSTKYKSRSTVQLGRPKSKRAAKAKATAMLKDLTRSELLSSPRTSSSNSNDDTDIDDPEVEIEVDIDGLSGLSDGTIDDDDVEDNEEIDVGSSSGHSNSDRGSRNAMIDEGEGVEFEMEMDEAGTAVM